MSLAGIVPRRQNVCVRISIRDDRGRRLPAVQVDAAHPPSVLHAPAAAAGNRGAGGATTEVFLNWDRALDDKGCLRRCPVCGCEDFFARKSLPQVTGLVVLVLAAVTAIVFLGPHVLLAGLLVLALVAGLDLAIRFFARWRLVCYGCRAEFLDTVVDRHHPRWNMALAEKYRAHRATRPPRGDAPAQAEKDT